MAIDHAALRVLIDAEPANAARSDAQVRDDWWLPDVTVSRGVTYQDLILWASTEGTARKIRVAIDDEIATPGTWINSVYNDLLALQLVLESGGDLDLARSDLRSMINSLAGAGLPLSIPNKQALFALSDEDMPRYQAEGFPTLDDASWLYHIGIARA